VPHREARVQTIVEIVIFRVKPHQQDEFWEAMRQWVSHIKEQPGFVSYNYMKSLSDPGVLVQILEFQYKFIAQDILRKYQEKIGDEKFYRFFHLLHEKPEIEYYEKIDILEEPLKPGEKHTSL
jgi:hypothetical protein